MEINNKWIWITGASSGIGRALAIEFSKYSPHLVLIGRNLQELEVTRDQCKSGGVIKLAYMDLENAESIHNTATELLNASTPVDILVNNGGISQRAEALETADAVSQKIMNINFFGTIRLTKILLPAMIANGGGQIVVITSLVGIIGSPKRTTYAASKHALHGYFDSLRAELFSKNIRVTLICPGFIRTNISLSAVNGDGAPQQIMDQKTDDGMDPAQLAIKAVKGIKQEKEEIYIGKKEILAIYLKRFVPGIFSKILRKAKVT